jgi:hypothetical protein
MRYEKPFAAIFNVDTLLISAKAGKDIFFLFQPAIRKIWRRHISGKKKDDMVLPLCLLFKY